MSNSIAPGSSADVNVKVTALTTNPNVPVTYKIIILKKNLVSGVNTLTQEMMSAQNTKYIIKYDYTLAENITVPANCVLEFDGGSISGNHTITGQSTIIEASNYNIFKCTTSKYRGYYTTDFYGTYNYVEKNEGIIIAGTWENKTVQPNWCGLIDIVEGTECSRAINNHIQLYSNSVFATIPNRVYYIYAKIYTKRLMDFNYSKLVVVGDYTTITDNTIPLPDGSTATALRSLYGHVVCGYDNGILKNLILDNNSINREETYSTFGGVGIAGALVINSSDSVTVENVKIINCPESAIITHDASNITFIKLQIKNCGEHGIYFHFNKGHIKFVDCSFIDYSNSEDIISHRGASAAVRFTGPNSSGTDAEYATSGIDFVNCEFHATSSSKRINYGPAPGYLNYNNCNFENSGGFQIDGTLVYNTIGKVVEIYCKDCSYVDFASGYAIKTYIELENCKKLTPNFIFDKAINCDFDNNVWIGNVVYEHSVDEIIVDKCRLTANNGMFQMSKDFGGKKLIIKDCYIKLETDVASRNQIQFTFIGLKELQIKNSTILKNYSFCFKLNNSNESLLEKLLFTNNTVISSMNSEIAVFILDSSISGLTAIMSNNSVCSSSKLEPIISPIDASKLNEILVDYKGLYNSYYNQWSASFKDGTTVLLPNSSWYGLALPDSLNLKDYLKITPKGNFTNFTYNVAKTGTRNEIAITINNGSQDFIDYILEWDVRHIIFSN